MANFRQFHIPSQDGADYYPLTISEVVALLEEAASIKLHNKPYAVGEISSIQVRLDQAIPGQMCPREIDGSVAKKTNELDTLYVEWIQSLRGNEPDITEHSPIVSSLIELMR